MLDTEPDFGLLTVPRLTLPLQLGPLILSDTFYSRSAPCKVLRRYLSDPTRSHPCLPLFASVFTVPTLTQLFADPHLALRCLRSLGGAHALAFLDILSHRPLSF